MWDGAEAMWYGVRAVLEGVEVCGCDEGECASAVKMCGNDVGGSRCSAKGCVNRIGRYGNGVGG